MSHFPVEPQPMQLGGRARMKSQRSDERARHQGFDQTNVSVVSCAVDRQHSRVVSNQMQSVRQSVKAYRPGTSKH